MSSDIQTMRTIVELVIAGIIVGSAVYALFIRRHTGTEEKDE